MTHSYLVRFAAIFALGAAVVSCDKPSPEKPAPVANTSSAAPPALVRSPPSASEKTPIPTPSASASAAADNPPDSVLIGTWEGRYESKKGDVGMPPRVEDKVRSKDDGKTAIGSGTLTLTVRKDLEIEGLSEGALGSAKLRGKVDGDDIRAAFDPVDVLDKRGMFGIISGNRKDDKIEAKIRVANGDATIVREADIVLRRKQ